jgi:hypothetical protein
MLGLRHILQRHRIPRLSLSKTTSVRLYTRPILPFMSLSSLPRHKSKILVLGAGNFGSCLADHLGYSAHDIYMWSRDEKLVKHFNTYHRNPDYLKDHAFSENIEAVGPDLPGRDFLKDMDVLLFSIPTQALR